MAIADKRLEQFFSKQRVGNFAALKQPATLSPKKEKLSEKPLVVVNAAPADISSENKTPTDSNTVDIDHIAHNSIVIDESHEPKNVKNVPLAIREQSVSEPLQKREQPVSESLSYSEQGVSEPSLKTLATPLAEKEEVHFTDLRIFSKKERELITLIFWQCHNNCSLESPPIYTEEIINTLKISSVRARNLIFRIAKKSGIHVMQHKSGQGAYRIFRLPKSLYQSITDQQTRRASIADSLAPPLANPLASTIYSSNSSLNNKITTTSLPDDWKKINFESLGDLGFSETQLKQLFETNCTTPEVVQQSINHFAFGLDHNEKIKTYKDPLNVFMGVLRKGQKWHEVDYVSPKESALRKLLEEKKKEKERHDTMIKEMTDLEFPEWRKKLTDNQVKMIVPEATLRMNVSSAITASLRTHYVENILLPNLEKIGIEEI